MADDEMVQMMKPGFVRINALLWADILVAYALFVMQDYLTDVWKISFTHAAGIMNVWSGISKMLALFFLFLADAFLGHFKMLVISNISYSVGIIFIAMSTPPILAKSTGMCKEYEPECIGQTQKALLYTGMALVAVGVAGNSASLKTFRDDEQKEKKDAGGEKFWFKFVGFTFVAAVGATGSAIVLPYIIKPWSFRFGVPAICNVVATIAFLSGWREYTKEPAAGSSITNICSVFLAAACKMSKSLPDNAKKYHKDDEDEMFKRTRFLRCLEKAAIKSGGEDPKKNSWRDCSIGEVEEAKIAVRMVPMWLTFVICGIVSSIANTYFVEQAKNMDRNIGKLKLPPHVLLLVIKSANGLFRRLANFLLGKEPENPLTGNPKNTENKDKIIEPSVGIGIGMVFSILCCITAAGIEKRRLGVIRSHGLLDKPDETIPMSVYVLLFQFILLAGLDSFLENSVAEFYKYQSPSSMKKYLKYFTRGVSGLGFMCSTISVYVVGKIRPKWFQFTLNKSRLDRYYWVLATMSSANLVVFIVVAVFYRYKDIEAQPEEDDGTGGEGQEELYTEENCDCKCC